MNVFTRHAALISSPPPRHSRERGMALLTAIIFISLALMILAVLSNRYFQQQLLVNQFQIYHTAFDGLEAVFEEARVAFDNGDLDGIGLDDWTPEYANGRLVLPDWDDNDVSPHTLSTNPEVEFIAYIDHWGSNGEDSNGDGTVDSGAEQGVYSFHLMSRFDGVTRQAEVVVRSMDVNIWQNAIFGGVGQSGALINGNVKIHGSVHLLGEALLEGATAINVMELSGTAMMHNSYHGMPSGLRSRVPALPTVDIDGVSSETLNAVLRVRQGLVSMSGNAHIGLSQNSVPSGYKGPVDGTYVTDGWTGNSVTADGNRGVPSNVNSDNGWDNLYDLGNLLNFPVLNDPWRDVNGSEVVNPDTGEMYSHDDYFTQILVGNQPNVPDHGIFEGDLTIHARNSPSFYWNATTQEQLTGSDADNATPGVDDDYIRFDANSKVLEANGQIRINGDLTFEGQGSSKTIHYSGRAAFLVDGDITVATNLRSCNNGNPTNTANSFPENNVLGFMATQNIELGDSSQLEIMGAFYAQDTVLMDKQTDVVGALVASYFDMGNQVPSIYHVPTLHQFLPYGMIGNHPILIMEQITWREIGID